MPKHRSSQDYHDNWQQPEYQSYNQDIDSDLGQALRLAEQGYGDSGVMVAFGRCEMKKTGLEIPSDFTEDEWEEIGQVLRGIDTAIQWILGDWTNWYVERQNPVDDNARGELYNKVATRFDLNKNTLQTYAWIARQVGVSIRVETLSFTHHRQVAKLPMGEQVSWLQDAVDNDWSASELRKAINVETEKPALPRRFENLINDKRAKAIGRIQKRLQKGTPPALKDIEAVRAWLNRVEQEISE